MFKSRIVLAGLASLAIGSGAYLVTNQPTTHTAHVAVSAPTPLKCTFEDEALVSFQGASFCEAIDHIGVNANAITPLYPAKCVAEDEVSLIVARLSYGAPAGSVVCVHIDILRQYGAGTKGP